MEAEARAALEKKVIWTYNDVRSYYNWPEKYTTHVLQMKKCPHATEDGKHKKHTSYKVAAGPFRRWVENGFR